MIASPFIRILERAPQLAALRNGCEFPLYYNVERRSAKSTRSSSFFSGAIPATVSLTRRPYLEHCSIASLAYLAKSDASCTGRISTSVS